jgi:hypothetical protein
VFSSLDELGDRLKAAQYVIDTVQVLYLAARMPNPIIVECRRDAEISRVSSVPRK